MLFFSRTAVHVSFEPIWKFFFIFSEGQNVQMEASTNAEHPMHKAENNNAWRKGS